MVRKKLVERLQNNFFFFLLREIEKSVPAYLKKKEKNHIILLNERQEKYLKNMRKSYLSRY
jgi:hypothetical protein